MSDKPVARGSPRHAVEIGGDFELGAEARSLLRHDQTAAGYLRLLEKHDLRSDALRFAANWLPKREAIWWCCLCLWRCRRPAPPGEAANVLRAVVRWLEIPSEENRRQIEAAAENAGSGPAGSLALAAFWSEGSLNPPGVAEVAAPPLATARFVAAALLDVTGENAAELDERYRLFLALAHDVAAGKNHWKRNEDEL